MTGLSGTVANRPTRTRSSAVGARGCTPPERAVELHPLPRAPKTSTTPQAWGTRAMRSAPPWDPPSGRPPKGESRRVLAVISDRSLTAGMAFEALNHAGTLPADLLVILNDSSDADRRGIGALSAHFACALSGPLYANLRAGGKRMLRQMPTMRELARRSEKHLKGMVLPGTLFEEMGFN
jgi:1-deoxy-D-xylulose-5-phosphate synthase